MHKFYNKLVICISNLAWKFKFHLGIPWILFFWWVVVFLMSTNLVLESFMTTRQGQNLLLYYTCNEKVSLRETIYYHFTISVHLKSSLIKGGGWLLVREVKPYKKETYTHWAWCNKIYSTYYWSLTCMATAIRTTFHVTTTIIVWGASFHTYTSISPYGRTFSWLVQWCT